MMNEREKRKADPEIHGSPVVLMDGQTWWFPRPRVSFRRAIRSDTGAPGLHAFTDLGADFDQILADLDAAETVGGEALGCLNLAACMLRVNYDLSDDDLAELLVFTPTDPANLDTYREIYDIARGRDVPKPQPAGLS